MLEEKLKNKVEEIPDQYYLTPKGSKKMMVIKYCSRSTGSKVQLGDSELEVEEKVA